MCVNEREAGEKVKVQGADVVKVAFKSHPNQHMGTREEKKRVQGGWSGWR